MEKNIILIVKKGHIDDANAEIIECNCFNDLNEVTTHLHRQYNLEYRKAQWQMWYSAFCSEKEFMWDRSHFVYSFYIQF